MWASLPYVFYSSFQLPSHRDFQSQNDFVFSNIGWIFFWLCKGIDTCGCYSVCVMTSSRIELWDCIIKYSALLIFLSVYLVISLDTKSHLPIPPPHDIHNCIHYCHTLTLFINFQPKEKNELSSFFSQRHFSILVHINDSEVWSSGAIQMAISLVK